MNIYTEPGEVSIRKRIRELIKSIMQKQKAQLDWEVYGITAKEFVELKEQINNEAKKLNFSGYALKVLSKERCLALSVLKGHINKPRLVTK